ncbi:hypothetical protein [Nocardioides szechwanensis]|uniref:hypothetical protein n=1 Tax=Nocardioides szechwanensis TaxID=1005944 RepID=UPI00115FB88F|nr:hypothetical protein [Nocardioides szechwanensis]
MSFTAVIAVVMGTTAMTAPAAHATDTYGTNFKYSCGADFPWGGYCQLTMTKWVSKQMKERLSDGETVTAIAVWACSKIPTWIAEGTCVAWITYNAVKARAAINNAAADSNKCVATRMYTTTPGQVAQGGAKAVACNFDIQCCAGGSGGGGGGGGGGGSWRQAHRPLVQAISPVQMRGLPLG